MTTDPNSVFVAKVERAYQGEVYGEALYKGLADAIEDAVRSGKWRVLTELEVVTKAHMRKLVAKLGGDTNESETSRQRGIDNVRKYLALPWNGFMKLYSQELDPVIGRYADLEKQCAPDDAPTLRLLTQHEVVTKAFCDLELAGRSDISINPTLELLDKARTLQQT